MWLAPLAAGGIGAAVLALMARRLEREVTALHRAMRPLRVGRPRRSG